jgi:arginine decarboxylase
MKKSLESWGIEKSADLYNIRNWGGGYFDIAENGNVVITPFSNHNANGDRAAVSMLEVIEGLKERGFDMPVLLRIENLLDAQLTHLHHCFNQAKEALGYTGDYRSVFPIKVNQQHQVISEMTAFGSRFHHGLEAGSKAELIAALAMLQDPEALLVTNGYKDEEFIDLGLYARKMGYNCFFVLETPSELDLILERSKTLGVRPLLGVRVKLSTQAGGHWEESGGDRSIFGLNTTQLIQVTDRLRAENMLDCLRLVHYHLGSQIPNIRDIRSAALEASRFYAGLVEEGAAMGYLDVGGGLAVDYDGSHTNYTNSRNYGVEEFYSDILEAVMATMDEKGLPHPTIITEAGRAVVAHYSVLLFNVLDTCRFTAAKPPEKLPEDAHPLVCNLMEVREAFSIRNVQECFNDAIYYRDEIRQLFKHGRVTLRQRSLAEEIFWSILTRIQEAKKLLKHPPKALDELDYALSDIYYCNFSVFQSLPDAWAINHLFPIMPVHRLNEEPTRRAVLADITCDCDGKIDKFIDPHGMRRTLQLHNLKEECEYYLGVFLVGAYQETLGDLHNLLGDTNVVTIRIKEDGSYDFARELEGDSVADVLSYVEYDTKALLEQFRDAAEDAVRAGRISAQDRRRILKAYRSGLAGYTYFER